MVESQPLKRPVTLVGTVTAKRQANLSTRIEGWVEQLHVDIGSQVKAGAELIRLDDTLAQFQREQTAQELEAARAELEEAQRRFEETRQVAESGGVAGSELDSRKSILRVRQAELKQLEIRLKEQDELLNRHRLEAPFPGVISKRMTQVGEWVRPGDTLFELVETKDSFFDVQAPQALFPLLSPETKVDLKMDSNGEIYSARIDSKVAFKDPVTRNFLVRLRPESEPDPNSAILPGASGKATFYIGDDAPVLTVPRDALIRKPDGSFIVWVTDPEAETPVAILRQVELGTRLDTVVEIRSGVAEGETVIIRGNENLQPDQPLRLLNESTAEDVS